MVADEPRVEIGPVTLGGTFEHEGRVFHRAQVGNPHAVTMVADPSNALVDTLGPVIESAVTGGTNVEFLTAVDRHNLALRVWERGVGETLACGSGMVAAAAVARHLGLSEETVSIRVPGGTGVVELVEGTSWLTGPVRVVYRGVI
jgi:diaminopimelate epimerase